MFQWGNTDNPKQSFTLYDQNPTKQLDDHPPFFSNFPSPFFDEHELPLHQILRNQCLPPPDPTPHNTSSDLPQINNGASFKTSADQPISDRHVAPPKRRTPGVVPRRRVGKKDRHSKICTAQGIRDRRMRLSLQVARKFFDLQDMLGYDKASKTIEWLFNKSKKAIKDLIQEKNYYNNNNNNINISISDDKSESFISDCEVLSGIDDGVVPKGTTPLCIKPRKSAKESREKARARARCRTREKLMINAGHNSGPNQDDLQKLGPDEGTIEKLLGVSDPNSNFMGFLGNWDLMNNGRLNLAAGNSISETTAPDFLLFNHQ